MVFPMLPNQKQIRLGRHGPYFKIDPACPEVLDVLKTVYHVADRDHEHGYLVQRLVRPMYGEHDDCGSNVMSFPAGLEPIVRKLLVDAGYRILTINELE